MADGLYDQIYKAVLKDMEKKKQVAIKRIQKEVPRNVANRLSKEAPRIVENAMNQFYLAYNPNVYVRTYGLYGGVASSVSVSYDKNNIYLEVSSDNVPDHKHDSGEYIYIGAFRSGIHGDSSICISTPPKMLIQEDLEDRANEIAEEEKSKIIKEIFG